MDVLSDYCQIHIIEYLSVTDQLALMEAFHGDPTSRWSFNVHSSWRYQRSFSLDAEGFKYFESQPELMDDFLRTTSPKMQQLQLPSFNLEILDHWRAYQFPEMRSLEYSAEEKIGEKYGNVYIELMAKLFPNLTNFKPCGNFEFIHLTNWLNLRRLDLSESGIWHSSLKCKEIEFLKMLEVLYLPNRGIHYAHKQRVLYLPKLRILTLHLDSEQHYYFVCDARPEGIERIAFHDSIWEFDHRIDNHLVNLRQLSILNDENLTGQELEERIIGYQRLERLDLINFHLLSSESNLWKTIDGNPSLKIVNLCGTKLSYDFFDIDRKLMDEVLNKRTVPLTMYFYNNGDYEHLIRLYFKHPNLKVTFQLLKLDHIDERFLDYCNSIQICFMPVKMKITKLRHDGFGIRMIN